MNTNIAMRWNKHIACGIKIFVEEMGWTELAKPDGREIDQFDN